MKRPRWVHLLLISSIGLNVFLLGMMASRHLDRRGFRERGGGPPAQLEQAGPLFAVRNVVRVMGGRQDARVKAIWDRNRVEMRKRGDRVKLAQVNVLRALAREPFSPQAATDAMARARAETQGVAQLAETSLLDLARALTPEERRTLGRHLEKMQDVPKKPR